MAEGRQTTDDATGDEGRGADPALVTPFGPRNRLLDGVRGLAILMVVIFHSTHRQSPALLDRIVGSCAETLWAGVDLFFVLSGFLITGILLDSRRGAHYFRNFYVRRTLRIFPLYYGVLFLVMVVIPLGARLLSRDLPMAEHYDTLLANQWWAWTYLHNYLQATGPHTLPGMGHFWSLAIEEQFYLLWPLCVFLLGGRRLLWFCIAVCVGALLLRMTLLANGMSGWSVRHLTPTRIDTLVYGAIGAIVVREPGLLRRVLPLTMPVILACLGALVGLRVLVGNFEAEAPLVASFGYTILALLFGAALVRIAGERCSAPAHAVLGARWLRLLGRYSYAIYVFHWPVANATGWLTRNLRTWPGVLPTQIVDTLINIVLVTGISLGLALVSWHLWEAQWLRLKRHFAYETNTTPAPIGRTEAAA